MSDTVVCPFRQAAKCYIETLDSGRCSGRAIDLWPWLSPVNWVSHLLRRLYPPHLDQVEKNVFSQVIERFGLSL